MSDVAQGPGDARAGPRAKGGGQLVVLLVAVDALAGAFGGGGVHSLVSDAVVTGIGWAVFGLVVGALYGLWAGRAVSASRLKSLGPYTAPGSRRLILRFNPVEGDAPLEAA